ncbi:hypothetical protein GALL_284330 [mine drainage metagenome]|uniref:Tetratricopeptide repeat protein n=1 Tax=mine drainage metagenome TaxID=410659 RepID=A0A1J5R143_9ZZZZ
MLTRNIAALLCVIGFAAAGYTAPVLAQGQVKSATVRPEVGKPLQAAVDLLKGRKAKAALAKIAEADAVKNKTPFEAYMVGRLRAQAEAAAGDAAAAARDFEATAASPAAPVTERMQFLAVAAGQYYSARQYAKAAELAARYFKAGGKDPALRTIYVQALYLGNDFALAGREILADVEGEQQAGKTPSEIELQMLATCYQKSNDKAGYARAMEMLVAFHPKHDYWLNVVYSVTTAPGFSDRLSLDADRLKLATGTMRGAEDYMEAAQLALQAGFPAEAKKFVDAGYAAGLLGTGPDAARHQRLRALTLKNLAEDRQTLGQDDARVTADKDGTPLVNTGLNYVLHGRFDKGLAMMAQGIKKGGFRHPDDARLHLGYAYQLAGQKQQALREFKTVRGTDGAAALARLWVIRLGQGT